MAQPHYPIPKAQWGSGPWQDEPDDARRIDEATNLPCWIRRAPTTGSLCGYVGVPSSHPAFGLPYDFDLSFDPAAPITDWNDLLKPRTTTEQDAIDRMHREYRERQLRKWEAVKDRKAVMTFVNGIKCMAA